MERLKKAKANLEGMVARNVGSSREGTHETAIAERKACSYGSDGLWREATSKSGIHAMVVGEEGRTLYTGSTNVRVWAAERGENTHVVSMRAFTSVTCMSTAAETAMGGCVWLGHSDGSVTSVRLETHEADPHAHLQAHKTAVTSLALAHDPLLNGTSMDAAELWTGSDTGTIRAWPELGRHGRHSVEVELPGMAGAKADSTPTVRALLYVPACGLMWSGGHGGIHLWDVTSHDYIAPVRGSEHVTALALVQVGGVTRVMSGHSHGRVVIWSLQSDIPLAAGTGGGGGGGAAAAATRAALLPEMWRQLCMSGWSPSHGRPGSAERVTALASCPLPALPQLGLCADEALCVGFGDGTIQTFLASSAERLRTWRAHHSSITAMAAVASPSPSLAQHGRGGGGAAATTMRLASASKKGTLRAWDSLMYEERRALAWRAAVGARCLSHRSVDVFVGTYNVNGHRADGGAHHLGADADAEGVRRWLDWRRLRGREPPALVALGFQEVVELKATEMIGSVSTENAEWWQGRVLGVLNEQPGRAYHVVATQQLVGILILVYAREDVVGAVSEVTVSTVKTGIGGMGGNKGAAAVRLRLWATPLVFCVAHLAAHQHNAEERNEHYRHIRDEMSFEPPAPLGGGTIAEHELPPIRGPGSVDYRALDHARTSGALTYSTADRPLFGHAGIGLGGGGGGGGGACYSFFFGDLNYRAEAERPAVMLALAAHQRACDGGGGEGGGGGEAARRELERVLQHDQLTRARADGLAFGGYQEPRLSFRPTYKFDPGTSNYDSSEKQRVPAWCDRILYAAPEGCGVHVNGYRSVESLMASDHKPVSASFTIRCDAVQDHALAALRAEFFASEGGATAGGGRLGRFGRPASGGVGGVSTEVSPLHAPMPPDAAAAAAAAAAPPASTGMVDMFGSVPFAAAAPVAPADPFGTTPFDPTASPLPPRDETPGADLLGGLGGGEATAPAAGTSTRNASDLSLIDEFVGGAVSQAPAPTIAAVDAFGSVPFEPGAPEPAPPAPSAPHGSVEAALAALQRADSDEPPLARHRVAATTPAAASAATQDTIGWGMAPFEPATTTTTANATEGNDLFDF